MPAGSLKMIIILQFIHNHVFALLILKPGSGSWWPAFDAGYQKI